MFNFVSTGENLRTRLCVQLLLRLPYVFRRSDWKGVYLHGPQGVEKSSVLEKSLVLFGLGRWYMPMPGNFSLGSSVRCEYDVVDFDSSRQMFRQRKKFRT